jgi:hypothetical protein
MDAISTETRLLSGLDAFAWQFRGAKCLRRALQFALVSQVAMILLIPARDILAIQHITALYVVMFVSALVLGAVVEALSRLSRHEVARRLDARFDLQERLQTAVEVYQRDELQLARLLIRDAASVLERVKCQRSATTVRLPVEAYYLLAAAAIAGLLLCLPAIPAMMRAKESVVLAHGADGPHHKNQNHAQNQDNAARLNAKSIQVAIGKTAFGDTVFASKPPDFASFVKRDDRLGLLSPNRKGADTDNKPSPYQISLNQEHGETTAFEPDTVSADEASERLSVIEQLSNNFGSASDAGADPQNQSRSDVGSSSDSATSHGSDAAERQGTKNEPDLERANGRNAERSEKGANDPKSSAGTPSGQIQAPARTHTGIVRDPNISGPRFGGGQYPHNAPGAGFPEWLRGPEDPHFMDAGQGEGENTGQSSGQPGVGHATMKEALENDTIIPTQPKDIHLSGRLHAGDQVSYQTNSLGPGAVSSPRASYKEVPTEYEFRAEEEMSRDQVPSPYRAQVKTYFSHLR